MANKNDHPEKVLEQYWLELAEGSTSSYGESLIPQYAPLAEDTKKLNRISQAKSTMSFYGSALHGNKKVFIPSGNLNTALQIRSTLHLMIGRIFMTIHL